MAFIACLYILIIYFSNTVCNSFSLKIMKQYHPNILLILNNSFLVFYFKATKMLIVGVCFISNYWVQMAYFSRYLIMH